MLSDLMAWQAVHSISEKYCLPFWGSYLIPALGAVLPRGLLAWWLASVLLSESVPEISVGAL